MSPLRASLTALVALLAATAGCSGAGGDAPKGDRVGTTSSSGAAKCVPGEQIACACPGGGHGAQVCAADGTSYGSCGGCSDGEGVGGAASTSTGASSAASTSSTSSAASSTSGATGGSGATSTSATSAVSTSASSSGAGAGGGSSGAGGASPACPVGPNGIDLSQVTLYSNPQDLASWPVTTTLTEVDFTNDGVQLAFDKQDGPNRWPDVTPPGWGGPLQYTLGMVECIDGQWYASAVIEFWYGLPAAGGNVALNDQVATNWYYDANRWGLLAGRQPATGETIGIFVAAGNLRNITADDPAQSPVMERSNVVLVQMPDVNGSTNGF